MSTQENEEGVSDLRGAVTTVQHNSEVLQTEEQRARNTSSESSERLNEVENFFSEYVDEANIRESDWAQSPEEFSDFLIDSGADNLLEYVRTTRGEIEDHNELISDYEGRIDRLRGLKEDAEDNLLESSATVTEYDTPDELIDGEVGGNNEVLEKTGSAAENLIPMLEEETRKEKEQKEALVDCVESEVDNYAEEAFDYAQETSHDLIGELEKLENLAQERQRILDADLDSEDFEYFDGEAQDHSEVIDWSRDAYIAQAEKVQYIANEMMDARNDLSEVVAATHNEVDTSYAENALDSLDEAYGNMGDVDGSEETYDSIQARFNAAVHAGLTEEELDTYNMGSVAEALDQEYEAEEA